jgi:eukaryotic-like serine/threonine-protein kinase
MAPEQIEGRGPADAQSDVYALGVMLYEILTGHLPHVGANSAETFNRIISRDPLPVRAVNAAIHPDLETVCLKAIDRDRGRRYASAEPMADDLRRFLDGEPILARPVGPVGRLLRQARRRPALALAAALALTCAALGVEILRPEASPLELELRHDPGNPSLHESLGLLRLRAGRKAEAAKSFERAIELAPERRARLQPRLDACRVP